MELADTPVFDELWEHLPAPTLTAWGPAVGLPEGQMGNSEVGHLNLGAGAVVKQDITRIDDAVADGSFARTRCSGRPARAARGPAAGCTFSGWYPTGGVHASMDHLRALVELAAARGRARHGAARLHRRPRHAAPTPAPATSRRWRAGSGVRVATVTRPLLRHGPRPALGPPQAAPGTRSCTGAGRRARARTRGEAAVRAAYERGETDEFIKPTLVGEEGRIRDGDAVVFFNFRPDRARELTRALGEADFAEFDRGDRPRVRCTTLTSTRRTGTTRSPSRPTGPPSTLASVLAERGVRQLHVAETEKYPHVTYFFNGGEEHPYERRGAPPGGLAARRATYDQKPEMARRGRGRRVRRALGGRRLRLRRSSTSPTRTWSATPASSPRPWRDRDRGRAASAGSSRRCTRSGGACIVTADHGNADNMLEPGRQPEHRPLA